MVFVNHPSISRLTIYRDFDSLTKAIPPCNPSLIEYECLLSISPNDSPDIFTNTTNYTTKYKVSYRGEDRLSFTIEKNNDSLKYYRTDGGDMPDRTIFQLFWLSEIKDTQGKIQLYIIPAMYQQIV